MPDPNMTECFASPDDHDLMADIFLPDQSKHNGAAVLLVHGGGWHAGDRSAFLWHAHQLSLHGYVAATIDYRLSGTAPFPAALEDCQAAVRWIRQNAARFDICSDRIGAVGSSAGGHLVACLGVLDNSTDDVSSKVNCVVDVHGVHDFVSTAEYGSVLEAWQDFIGGPITDKRDLWVEASPALHVDASSAPMLLIHDPEDPIVPYSQSVILAEALMKNARPVSFVPSPGSSHGFFYNHENEWLQKTWPTTVEWLDRYLG